MSESTSDASEAGRNLSKLGATKGGRARANVLTPEERHRIAKQAAQARWAKAGKAILLNDEDATGPIVLGRRRERTTPESDMPFSLFRGTLDFGQTTIECHVLNDHRRVLTQTEVVRVLTGGTVSGNLLRYLSRL